MLKKLIIAAMAICVVGGYLFLEYVGKPGAYDKPVELLVPRGANSYTAIEYKVYYMDYASANDTANTYKVTVANA